jgi:hypothetical protein
MPGAGAIHPICFAFKSDGSRLRGAGRFVADAVEKVLSELLGNSLRPMDR